MSLPALPQVYHCDRDDQRLRRAGVGLIHIELFATLDLVGQAPGGPNKGSGGLSVRRLAGAAAGRGRRGAGCSPRTRARTRSCSAGDHLRHLRRLLAASGEQPGQRDRHALQSRSENASPAGGQPDLSWAGSTQLGPDLASAVREIRERHEHVKVVGSLNLVQSLLREKLFDRLDLWVHPIVLGVGKRVFADIAR